MQRHFHFFDVPPARLLACFALVCSLFHAAPSKAQSRQGLANGPWPLESIELADGRTLEGLVIAPAGVAGTPRRDSEDIEFLQIVRRPGRSMHLVAWPAFPSTQVRFVERLLPREQKELRDRVEAFREERRKQDDANSIVLERHGDDAPWRYVDRFFVLESSAPAPLTREAVVRLLLMFDALESLVPPICEAKTVLKVRLCGSLAEYREAQEEAGLRLENPAFYVADRRLLVAGSELPQLLEDQRAADRQLDMARQEYLEQGRLLEERLRLLAADLTKSGMPMDERQEVIRGARMRGTREQSDALERIDAARRTNAALVTQARRRFHERLAHEAWHAYADGRLRAGSARGLPPWLDEGLAQVVETAPLEAGELRLDAPDRARLKRVKEAITTGSVMPLADLVSMGQEAFVGGHGGKEAVAYLAAWAVAFDLAVLHPVLTAEKIVALADSGEGETDPIDAAQALVGQPIDHFDRQWRQRALKLQPRPINPAP